MKFQYTRPRLLLDGAFYAVLLAGAAGFLSWESAPEIWDSGVRAVPSWAGFIIGIGVLHFAAHWVAIAGLAVLERLLPDWTSRFRIQPARRDDHPPDLLRVVLTNQLVALPLTLAAGWGLLVLRGWDFAAPLPGAGRVLAELAVLALFTEVSFWSAHRLLHRPWWFRAIHRVHHRYRAPRPIAASYMHPIEFAGGNIAPMLLGIVAIGAHPFTAALLTVFATLNIVFTHSGLHLPGLPWAVHHEWHHHKIRGCYGALYLLDWLTGSDRELHEWAERSTRSP